MMRPVSFAILLMTLGIVGGCGPAGEPTRFTPTPVANPVETRPAEHELAPVESSAPARNIKMH